MVIDSYGQWVEALTEGRLPPEKRARLELHLAECPECRNYRLFLERLGRISSRTPETWLQKAPAGLPDRVIARLWRPRSRLDFLLPSPAFRPAWAAAAAAFLLAVGYWGGRRSAEPAAIALQLTLDAPRAQSVAVAGDFNDWRPQSLKRRGEIWVATVRLKPGRYEYAFILNDRVWMVDPRAPEVIRDEKGRPTGVLDIRGL